jgi:ribosomal protein S27AE
MNTQCPKCGKIMHEKRDNDGDRDWVCGRWCDCGYKEGDV